MSVSLVELVKNFIAGRLVHTLAPVLDGKDHVFSIAVGADGDDAVLWGKFDGVVDG